MALHGGEDRNDMAMSYRRVFFMIHTPIQESFVGNDVETLFGRRGLGECIGNIGTKNK